jgi:hypothetical protein
MQSRGQLPECRYLGVRIARQEYEPLPEP